jgi:hypothetical protein
MDSILCKTLIFFHSFSPIKLPNFEQTAFFGVTFQSYTLNLETNIDILLVFMISVLVEKQVGHYYSVEILLNGYMYLTLLVLLTLRRVVVNTIHWESRFIVTTYTLEISMRTSLYWYF